MLSFDIVVAGGGLAAMKSAVTAARGGQTVLMTVKTHLCGGASFYPMMDMVACQSSTGVPGEDEAYMAEILDASQGMADEEMNRVYIDAIRQRVSEFPEIGVDNARITDPKVACFAKTARPTYCWSDWPHIRQNMRGILARTPAITLMEQTSVVSILKTDGAVSGVLLLRGGEIETVACKSLILATGGMGDLYEFNLNTPDVSGDGQALSLLAGARLINAEFLQLIPGFVFPAYKTVFRETTIPYLQELQTADGRDLLEMYLPNPVDRAECLRLRGKHGPFTNRTIARYFDIAMMEEILKTDGPTAGFPIRYRPEIGEDHFTFVGPYVQWLREKHGVDLAKDEIHIAPFYHAANGGVRIGRDCQTDVPGLFACGEVSGGIHGADRLGGHSTGSCLVFGYLAGQNAALYAQGASLPAPQSASDALHRDYAGSGSLSPDQLLAPIRRLMFRTGNVVREEKPLREGLAKLRQWQCDFDALSFLQNEKTAPDAIKAQHFLLLGQALLSAMLERRESRGSHYRKDYPQTNPAFDKRQLVSLQNGKWEVRAE